MRTARWRADRDEEVDGLVSGTVSSLQVVLGPRFSTPGRGESPRPGCGERQGVQGDWELRGGHLRAGRERGGRRCPGVGGHLCLSGTDPLISRSPHGARTPYSLLPWRADPLVFPHTREVRTPCSLVPVMCRPPFASSHGARTPRSPSSPFVLSPPTVGGFPFFLPPPGHDSLTSSRSLPVFTLSGAQPSAPLPGCKRLHPRLTRFGLAQPVQFPVSHPQGCFPLFSSSSPNSLVPARPPLLLQRPIPPCPRGTLPPPQTPVVD